MTTTANNVEVPVPDIGDFSDIPVIEVLVSVGDKVNADDPVITLESDKATMDVPAPIAGTVTEVRVAVGDHVSKDSVILLIAPGEGAVTPPPSLVEQQEPEPATPVTTPAAPPVAAAPVDQDNAAPAGAHAGPSVRRMARELGVDLAAVTATGPKGRITKDDLLSFLKGPAEPAAAATAPAAGAGIPEVPAQDYAAFGPVERVELSRIKRLSGPYLHRSWLNVPHVTQHDEADITALDAYRRELDTAAKADRDPYRVTLLAFLVKAAVSALKQFPEFNSSLAPEKDALVLKGYYNIGIAVDTPGGLVVPVVKDADRKGIVELSREFADLSGRARAGKLKPPDMQGGTFTISSLGGIGGTGFTPIVNAPEVAILGVVRSAMKPVWNGKKFKPRLMLPLSVSYDHRVIDGALAARFTRHLCHLLERATEGCCCERAGDPRPRDRGFPRDPRHRDPRGGGRHRGGGRPVGHAGERQGDHGRALAGGGHGDRAVGRPRRQRLRGHADHHRRRGRGGSRRRGAAAPSTPRPRATARRQHRPRHPRRPPPRRTVRSRPTPGRRATCTPRCSCSAPGPAATRPRSGRPTWARAWCSSTPAARSAVCASTSAASRPRPCCTRPR